MSATRIKLVIACCVVVAVTAAGAILVRDAWSRRVPTVTAHVVAAAFEFPDSFEVESIEHSVGGVTALWAARFDDQERAFATTTVAVFEGGALLTDDRIREFGKLNAEMRLDATLGIAKELADSALRRFDFPDGREGFAYIDGFGPGGVGYAVAFPSPDRRFDIHVSTAYSFGDSVREGRASRQYFNELHERPLALLERAARIISRHMFGDAGY
ncbi:MAG: hypothetical protein WD066_11905 [Planctomycetaceae bacterium]